MAHDQPTYASVPGIRVFGKYCNEINDMCVSLTNQYCRHDVRQTGQFEQFGAKAATTATSSQPIPTIGILPALQEARHK